MHYALYISIKSNIEILLICLYLISFIKIQTPILFMIASLY